MPVDQMGVLALQRALTQAAALLDEVRLEDLGLPTPCADWDVRDLANHMIAVPRIFVTQLQGSPPGWNGREDYSTQLGEELRTRGNALINLWREVGDDAILDPDWQAAEIAVHTWDLATALGRSSDDLDTPLAERSVVTMDRILGPIRKGRSFKDARQAPPGSNAYEHLAAYAGREVPWRPPSVAQDSAQDSAQDPEERSAEASGA